MGSKQFLRLFPHNEGIGTSPIGKMADIGVTCQKSGEKDARLFLSGAYKRRCSDISYLKKAKKRIEAFEGCVFSGGLEFLFRLRAKRSLCYYVLPPCLNPIIFILSRAVSQLINQFLSAPVGNNNC